MTGGTRTALFGKVDEEDDETEEEDGLGGSGGLASVIGKCIISGPCWRTGVAIGCCTTSGTLYAVESSVGVHS